MANTLNFEKAVKEVLPGVISISYGKEGKMNTAYVSTKNIIARYSTMRRLHTVMYIHGFIIDDVIASGRPAQNNEITYEIRFTSK